MRITIYITASAIIAACAWGNPIVVTHPSYIASEHIAVSLTDTAAAIDGKFHFRSTAKKGDLAADADVDLDFPIWIPSDPTRADAATKNFLESFLASQINYLNESNRSIWDAAIGAKASVGNHSLTVETFAIFDPSSKQDQQRIPKEWQKPGFYCVLVNLGFPPSWLIGNPEIHLEYRQPLRLAHDGAEFVYVPIFWHLPEGHSTAKLEDYAMTLTNQTISTFYLGSVRLRPSYSSVLPLYHHDAINAKATKG